MQLVRRKVAATVARCVQQIAVSILAHSLLSHARMLFNSFIFFAFLAIVLALYRRLEHRGQNRMLLVASYVFYGYWDWRFLSLIFI
jgi:hypothetical protein